MKTLGRNDKPHADPEQPKRAQRESLVSSQVLTALGQPKDLHRVQVVPLWKDCYRVNVWAGTDCTSAKIAQSYFLVVDTAGTIIESSPCITRAY